MATDLPTNNPALSRVDKFLAGMTTKPASRGNLIFAIDATGSRESTWDNAVHLQAMMFEEIATLGVLDVQLVYFRGTHGINTECQASGWMTDARKLAAYMADIKCRAGLTQIKRVLEHALREASQRKVGALVFVGDSCEEERDQLGPLARRLAEFGVPIFIFQEGRDVEAEMVFRELAQITRGAFDRFDSGSAKQLGDLLKAAAVYAVGGTMALERQGSAAAKLLLSQIR